MRVNFPQFAFNNVRRNGRAYLAYLLSSAFMVMIFFTYSVFIYHPDIDRSSMGSMTKSGMSIATVIVYVFAFFFVLYSISVFLKSRNREFGILTILGAESRQINMLILLENMIIGAVAVVSGIGGGLLLSKMFLLISSRVIELDDLPFYWPVKAMLLTAAAFTVLFLVISLFTLIFINRSQVLELLTGGSKPKKEPRANFGLALLGAALLATGYAALRVGQLNPLTLLLAAVTGIAGTYFFYSQLSVWAVRVLQRSRARTWKGTNLLWISEMSYKLRDNARMLFLVTVVTSLACMSVGFVLATQQSFLADFKGNPFAITFKQYDGADEQAAEPELAEIDKRLHAAGLSYRRIQVETLYSFIISNNSEEYLMIIPRTRYNEFAAAMGTVPAGTLNMNAALLVQTPEAAKKRAVWGDSVDIQLSGTLRSLNYETRTEPLAAINSSNKLLVVNDELYEELERDRVSHGSDITRTTLYTLPDSEGPPGRTDPETVAGMQLNNWNTEMIKQGKSTGYLSSRAENYYSVKQTFSLFSFIGIFIALIFSFSSASFLYFKLHAGLAADQVTYRSLSKIGLSSREMNTSATLQIAVLFFIPIIVAAIQSFVVLGPVLDYIKIPYLSGPVLIASAAFLLAQTVYFLIARARYIRSVNSMMV
jgi:putative ABC transport system permease protein